MTDQPLLIALVAVQFMVHALGWAMAAHLARSWRFAEGHFAAYWLFLATGLMLYVPPWPSGSFPRDLGDMLIVAALALQHRGMALYWGQRPSDRGYAFLLALSLLVVAASFTLENGHGLRVAMVCVGVGTMVLATVRLIWRNGRAAMPKFSAIVAGGYCIFALALYARAVQALSIGAQTKISIDAPGHSNVPLPGQGSGPQPGRCRSCRSGNSRVICREGIWMIAHRAQPQCPLFGCVLRHRFLNGDRYHARSSTIAMPCPTPIHMVHRA